MKQQTQQQSTTEKSQTTTYKVVVFLFIVTLLIYIHDVIPKNVGKIGLSSARVYFYTVLAEIRYLAVLFFCFYLAKNKSWRFVLALPIILTTYQSIIRIFALQKTVYNSFDYKLVITILVSIAITFIYFNNKKKK